MLTSDLIEHPFWDESDPAKKRLVYLSSELPEHLNPFVSDGVVIRVAGVPGEAPNSKWVIAREGILRGVEESIITQDTRIIEATSGNTGVDMADVCIRLGLRFVAVMSGDVPQDKINAIRVLGHGTGLQLLFDSEETTVQYARRIGTQEGWYNPDQYKGTWNPEAHRDYLAPQLYGEAGGIIDLLFVPSGTMGSSMGLEMYSREQSCGTTVVPVLCAEDQEVPGARSLASVQKDILQSWEKLFNLDDLEFGYRHESFHLSFLTWPYVPQKLGPSFGLAYAGALRFLRKHRETSTLDQFRNNKNGKIHVVVFGPDDYRAYIPLYLAELNRKKEFSMKAPPADLLSVLKE